MQKQDKTKRNENKINKNLNFFTFHLNEKKYIYKYSILKLFENNIILNECEL